MTTAAKKAKYYRQLAKIEAHKRTPDKIKMLPRERIRVKHRCKLCGRASPCIENLASTGSIFAGWRATV